MNRSFGRTKKFDDKNTMFIYFPKSFLKTDDRQPIAYEWTMLPILGFFLKIKID